MANTKRDVERKRVVYTVSIPIHEQIVEAAQLLDQPLSAFTVTAVYEYSKRIIAEQQRRKRDGLKTERPAKERPGGRETVDGFTVKSRFIAGKRH